MYILLSIFNGERAFLRMNRLQTYLSVHSPAFLLSHKRVLISFDLNWIELIHERQNDVGMTSQRHAWLQKGVTSDVITDVTLEWAPTMISPAEYLMASHFGNYTRCSTDMKESKNQFVQLRILNHLRCLSTKQTNKMHVADQWKNPWLTLGPLFI